MYMSLMPLGTIQIYSIDNYSNILDLLFGNEIGMNSDLIYLPGIGRSDHVCLRFSVEQY